MNREDPDILCLQEVRFNPYRKSKVQEFLGRYVSGAAPGPEMIPGKHMLEDLFQHLPQYRSHYVWEPGMRYDDHQVEGLAILSKFPIRSHAVKRLSKHERDGNSRICLSALIAHPWGDIQVFDTHFTYAVEGQPLQCKEVSRFLVQENKGIPQLLMGDFNCFKVSSIANRFLSGESIDGESLLPLRDVWTELNSSDPGRTFPSYKPKERLDRILCSPGLQPTACYKVGEASVPDVWASDHCGLVAIFRLP